MTMTKLIACCIFTLSFILASHAQQPTTDSSETAYIADDLIIYMHSGPGRNYRIIGSIPAGSKVQKTRESDDGKYVRIVDNKARIGWVQTEYVSDQPSIRERLPQMQSELLESKQQADQAEKRYVAIDDELKQLKSSHDKTTQQLADIEAQNLKLNQQLAERDKSEQMSWFLRGGAIALGGIILGVIITYLPKKRRRNDQWM